MYAPHSQTLSDAADKGGLPPLAAKTDKVVTWPLACNNLRNAIMYSKIVKRYANWNVCFSCGFDVEDGHTSTTCPALWWCTNHQEGFDQKDLSQYIAAGIDTCTKAMHKSQLPNMWQCGAEQVKLKCLKPIVSEPTLYPTKNVISNGNDKTIVTLNVFPRGEVCAPSVHPRKPTIPPSYRCKVCHGNEGNAHKKYLPCHESSQH